MRRFLLLSSLLLVPVLFGCSTQQPRPEPLYDHSNSVVSVEPHEVDVRGALSKATWDRKFEERREALRGCVPPDGSQVGTLAITLVVGPDGEVLAANGQPQSPGSFSPRTFQCLAGELTSWSFPEAGGQTQIVAALAFESKSAEPTAGDDAPSADKRSPESGWGLAADEPDVDQSDGCTYEFTAGHVLTCPKMTLLVADVPYSAKGLRNYHDGRRYTYEERGIELEPMAPAKLSVDGQEVEIERFSAEIDGEPRRVLTGGAPDPNGLRPFTCRVAPDVDDAVCGDKLSGLLEDISAQSKDPQLFFDGRPVEPDQKCVGLGKKAVKCGSVKLSFYSTATQKSGQQAVSELAAKTAKVAAKRMPSARVEPVRCEIGGRSVPCDSVRIGATRLLIFGRTSEGSFRGAMCEYRATEGGCLGVVSVEVADN
ncbi:hypothetical protein FIV42_28970 [Persicimonas caeni]|uniref:AgmX/PglI C-terminal domain-containing protein n=1 Tax=Persicimonas caeni TaxID=2292766 RepID=A0A4Y6Q256_PERCE|nr:hypothetical protein [Persicimonas caeni]QDG54633.1 hypothetical protein FIV42_28970 [Persicimonas caeni]QED35854.1 hypothetical protein FRD00_28965 [Persicimonas caeni]